VGRGSAPPGRKWSETGLVWVTPNGPRWLSAPVYVALGWVAIFVLPEIARAGTAAHTCTLLAALCHQVALYFALFR